MASQGDNLKAPGGVFSHSYQAWCPPAPGFFKFNSDAAFDALKGIVAIALKDGCSRIVKASSPLAAKALAFKEALTLAKTTYSLASIFETDSLILFNALKGP
ncbi:conserved hypothetical protein [Ricinus communis]|uniref:RNase H type-1 domain-containing protein n=1 Tax=Ricinus communis TaxID=3988 RepID=B9T594_RICCO|nr:conserved hypothetical protein [Ricinus communis]